MGAAGRYVRTYLAAPRYERSAARTLTTEDGVRLSAAHLPGPPGGDLTVVVVHGFTNWSRSPRVHAFARMLAADAEVIVPDLRGHGRSGGRCSFGPGEALDVAAAVAAAGPGRRVVTVGASLGGAAVLLHAADAGASLDTVVAVSPPAWWGRSDRPGARRIQRWAATPVRRTVLAGLVRTRLEVGAVPAAHPADRVAAVSPARTVIVHDPDDVYFGPEHAEALHAAAADPKELWWMPGAGHGTDLFTPELAARVVDVVSRPR